MGVRLDSLILCSGDNVGDDGFCFRPIGAWKTGLWCPHCGHMCVPCDQLPEFPNGSVSRLFLPASFPLNVSPPFWVVFPRIFLSSLGKCWPRCRLPPSPAWSPCEGGPAIAVQICFCLGCEWWMASCAPLRWSASQAGPKTTTAMLACNLYQEVFVHSNDALISWRNATWQVLHAMPRGMACRYIPVFVNTFLYLQI